MISTTVVPITTCDAELDQRTPFYNLDTLAYVTWATSRNLPTCNVVGVTYRNFSANGDFLHFQAFQIWGILLSIEFVYGL